MSTTIFIMGGETSYQEKEVNGKKHTQRVQVLKEVVIVPFGIKIDEFCKDLEEASFVNYTDCGFTGEIEGTKLLELVKKYDLIVLEEICNDDYYEVEVDY